MGIRVLLRRALYGSTCEGYQEKPAGSAPSSLSVLEESWWCFTREIVDPNLFNNLDQRLTTALWGTAVDRGKDGKPRLFAPCKKSIGDELALANTFV